MTELHEFHFIMERSLREKLMNLELYKKMKNLSGLITRILSMIAPIIKREHTWGEQRGSRYLPVCDDPDEIREHTHVYLPEAMYRELKLLHQDLNFFSIAQMVREFLWIFLDLINENEAKTLNEIKSLFRHWNKEVKGDSLTPHEVLRQLKIIIQHLPGKTGLINIYNKDSSPFWLFRL